MTNILTPHLQAFQTPSTNPIAGVLAQQAVLRPEKDAVVFQGTKTSYAQLLERTLAVVAQLRDLGVKKGDNVGLFYPNDADFAALFFAIIGAGAVIVPINPLLKSEEVAHIMSDSGARVLIAHQQTLPEVLQALPKIQALQHLVVAPECPVDLPLCTPSLKATSLTERVRPETPTAFCDDIDPAVDLALIMYTSGTTGKPKGAMLSHGNLLSVFPEPLLSGLEIDHNDRCLGMLPFCHIYGAGAIVFSTIAKGATIVVLPKFDAKAVLETIERERVTLLPAVPAMYQFMLMEMDALPYDVSSVRLCLCAAAPLSVELMTRIEDAFNAPVIEGYGLTETTGGATIMPVEARKIGCVGKPVKCLSISIRGADGKELPAGKENIGEIAVKGPSVMLGYHNRPDATAEVMDGEWFLTGDLGYRDEDGYIYIAGRKKELIIRGGQNIYPREVEDVIMRLPGVREAAVIGVPDEYMGERVKAVVVADVSANLSGDDIRNHCAQYLASYKVPRLVEFRTELPRNSTGKVLKRLLT